jgi:hypothetical protein
LGKNFIFKSAINKIMAPKLTNENISNQLPDQDLARNELVNECRIKDSAIRKITVLSTTLTLYR